METVTAKMKSKFYVSVITYIILVAYPGCVHSVQAVNSILTPVFPCNDLVRSDVLIKHQNVFACKGTWNGHIGKSDEICNKDWHICSWKDEELLKKISWYEATHIRGCFVINAAQSDQGCSSCAEKSANGEMAAMGADCVRYNPSGRSCFGGGRIDASYHLVQNFTSCHPAPWITGVLCCRDEEEGSKPEMTTYPEPYVDVISGSTVTLYCEANGSPAPEYEWFKNGKSLTSTIMTSPKYNLVGGKLTIVNVTVRDQGFYHCKAENRLGSAVSYKSMLRIREPSAKSTARGCRHASSNVKTLNGAEVAFCKGHWEGHIKRASKQLCAKGWRVCSTENMRTLHGMSWNDITKGLPGCYAYNAATSKYFPCSKCTPKRQGNRMSGLGQGCGNVDTGGYSCLSKGRIDVRSDVRATNGTRISRTTRRKLRSCSYEDDVTTGVACCMTQRMKLKLEARRRKGQHTQCKCKNGGKCTRGNACRCKRGFKGKFCQHIRET